MTPRLRGLLSLWTPVVACMGAIFYVSSLPQPPLPPGGDKPWHSFAYFGLGVFVVRAVAGGLSGRIDLAAAARAAALAIAYAISDEWHQAFVPGRSADAYDLVADAVGVVAATVACCVWSIITPGSPHRAGKRAAEAPASRDEL